MMYGAPRPPLELPPTSGLRQQISDFQPGGGQPVDPAAPPLHHGGPIGLPPRGLPGQMHPLQQGNQQAMLGAMRGYLQ